jgi:hypothetical protein
MRETRSDSQSMSVQDKLANLYRWLVETGMDKHGNMIMPWNHVDTAVEWAWMNLIHTPTEELREYLATGPNALDRLILEKTIDRQSKRK